MKYTHNADGSTTIQYTKLEAQKYQHYRGRCEEMLRSARRIPNDSAGKGKPYDSRVAAGDYCICHADRRL